MISAGGYELKASTQWSTLLYPQIPDVYGRGNSKIAQTQGGDRGASEGAVAKVKKKKMPTRYFSF